MGSLAIALAAFAVPCVLAGALPGQCSTTIVGQFIPSGVNATEAWDPDGTGPLPQHLVMAGTFTFVGGTAANGIAAWNPQTATWSTFGSGVAAAHVLGVLPGGDLVVAGSFASAGGVAASNIARWTGSAWAPLGSGVAGAVGAMVVTPGGQLVVSHLASSPMYTVSRWDGVSWTSLGSWPGGELAIAPNGDLLRGGQAGIERWNGLFWLPHAPGITNIWLLASMPDGSLFAAGTLASQGLRCAVWDGVAWTALGPQIIGPFGGPALLDVEFLPDGAPVICGFFNFFGGLGLPGGLARWTGSTWVGFGPGGMHGLDGSQVYTATFLRDGQLAVTGLALGLRFFPTTCPAQVAPAGAGCQGSGGANQLAVETRAWIGGTFRARGTGLPALAFVSEVYGFSTLSLPLSAVLPQGQPGCDLLVAPDFVNFSIATAGAAITELRVPDAPSLVGAAFYHQLNLFEVDASWNFVAITASNALALTVGAY